MSVLRQDSRSLSRSQVGWSSAPLEAFKGFAAPSSACPF